MLAGVLPLLLLALWVAALVHCIATAPEDVRYLPKFGWLLIVFFLPLIGSVLWFALGRPVAGARPAPRARRAQYVRPRRPVEQYDDPRYSPIAGITDRRSAELDLEIERWERAQRERREPERDTATDD